MKSDNVSRKSRKERPVTAAFCAAVEDTLAGLLQTRQDVILLQGEAVLGLEAAARGIGGPGRRVLNIVTW